MPTNWPDRVGSVGRGLLRFGAALCAKKPSSRRYENNCIYRKPFEPDGRGGARPSRYKILATANTHDGIASKARGASGPQLSPSHGSAIIPRRHEKLQLERPGMRPPERQRPPERHQRPSERQQPQLHCCHDLRVTQHILFITGNMGCGASGHHNPAAAYDPADGGGSGGDDLETLAAEMARQASLLVALAAEQQDGEAEPGRGSPVGPAVRSPKDAERRAASGVAGAGSGSGGFGWAAMLDARWRELESGQRKAARELGWGQDRWDSGRGAELRWVELGPAEQRLARKGLGVPDGTAWDGARAEGRGSKGGRRKRRKPKQPRCARTPQLPHHLLMRLPNLPFL